MRKSPIKKNKSPVKRTSKKRSSPRSKINKSKIIKGGNIQNLNMVCMTFNMGEISSKDSDSINNSLSNLMRKWTNELNQTNPDIIVISLQECKDPSPIRNYFEKINYSLLNSDPKDNSPTDKVAAGVPGLPGKLWLGYIYLLIYIRNDIKTNPDFDISISNRLNTFKCEMAKGSVSRVLVINNKNTSQYIINLFSAHLPSNPSKIDDRNKCILNSIFIDGDIRYPTSTFYNESLIFMGDLNYRTDSDNTEFSEKDPIGQEISSRTCDTLNNNTYSSKSCLLNKTKQPVGCFESDQLTNQLQNFNNKANIKDILIESPITFCPSCRLIETSDNNPVRKYHSKRVPSWCDRILTNNNFDTRIQKGIYSAFNISNNSDHLTVYQHFAIPFNTL